MRILRSILTSLWVAVMASICTTATAADYPTKPITIIMPFATGGGFDVTARALARGMQAELRAASPCGRLHAADGYDQLAFVSEIGDAGPGL